jgi:hypothetical protein
VNLLLYIYSANFVIYNLRTLLYIYIYLSANFVICNQRILLYTKKKSSVTVTFSIDRNLVDTATGAFIFASFDTP